MTKTTRALSGASKDAYFHDVLVVEGDVSEAVRERLLGRFQKGVSQVRIRISEVGFPGANSELAPSAGQDDVEAPEQAVPSVDAAFDPYSPNVLVVVRREGAAVALSQLLSIGHADHLRLLAREQQLSIGEEITQVDEIARAIVAAAERRIANMKAAAR